MLVGSLSSRDTSVRRIPLRSSLAFRPPPNKTTLAASVYQRGKASGVIVMGMSQSDGIRPSVERH
jgi:hypothetical protein